MITGDRNGVENRIIWRFFGSIVIILFSEDHFSSSLYHAGLENVLAISAVGQNTLS